jgi:membrane protein
MAPASGRGTTPAHGSETSAEDGALGRHAGRPGEIPGRGWLAVLRRVANDAISDEAGAAAASCGFYALLALFPTISVAVSLYGLVADPLAVEGQLEGLRGVLPTSTYELIAARVRELAAKGPTELSWGLALGLPVALWSAMNGAKSIIAALNVAYQERERRSFLNLNLVALLFTLGGIVGVAVALAVIVGVPAALPFTWLGPLASAAVRACSFALLLGFTVVALAVLYRFAPSRAEARWRWITPGSLLAAGLWLLTSLAFSFYVSNFGSYDAYYGTLGGVVVALLWFYISAYAVILGAELNAELELQTRRDTTTHPERPMGERDAFVADHVAAG